MLRRIVLALVVNAAALSAAAGLINGIRLSDRVGDVLAVAAIFGLVNLFVKPLIKFFALPFILITLGLFTLVINAGMLMVADRLAPALTVDGFGSALLGGVVISLVTIGLKHILEGRRKRV